MNETEVLKEFMSGRNCAQCVLGAFADEGGYDVEETDRFGCLFGGGMMMAQTCGAVTGGLMACGMLGAGKEKALEFEARFTEKFGTCVCHELLGKQPLAEAKANGTMMKVCPGYVAGAIEIVKEIM